MKPFDLGAIVVSIAAAAFFCVYAYSGRAAGKELIIEASGNSWVYSLDETRTVRIKGPLGETVIDIGNGTAAFTDSPCPDKLCVNSGSLSSSGQWAACLPNGVMMRIGGAQTEKLDDVSF